MRCAGEPDVAGTCAQVAVAVVAVDELLTPVCGVCLLATARAGRAGAVLLVRTLRRPGPGRPRPVIALTCTT